MTIRMKSMKVRSTLCCCHDYDDLNRRHEPSPSIGAEDEINRTLLDFPNAGAESILNDG